jgi:hypothetical protein
VFGYLLRVFFDSLPVGVVFIGRRNATGTLFLGLLRFSFTSNILPTFHTHLSTIDAV